MFIGHYAVAFAAKRVAPRISLGTLFLSTQIVDLVWPILVLLGVESVRIVRENPPFLRLDFTNYPFTHSLVGALGWSALVTVAYWLGRRYPRGALVVGVVAFSHWLLDLVSHRPDLPLVPGGAARVGLGLWTSVPGTLIVEAGIFVIGVALYLRATTARDRVGSYALWTLVAVLALIYLANLASPPPPDQTAVGIAGLGLWLLVPWAYWIDRHRRAATA
ncbi:MAG: hypothetical protein QN178_03140 [Armatimonadota bacterium]|nr:hypothetical protein [Armatimonadota bacterium]